MNGSRVLEVLKFAQDKAVLAYDPPPQDYPDLPLPDAEPVQVDDLALAYCKDKEWIHIRDHYVEFGWEVRTNVFEPCVVTEMTLTQPGRVALYEMQQSEQPEADTPEEAPSPRLVIRLACKKAMLDGKDFDVPSDNAMRWVKVLAEHPGEWISGPNLEQYDKELIGARTDRLKKFLPPEIQNLIDSDTGKGSRIRLTV